MSKEKIVLNVEGMSCSHCVNSVKEALSLIDGVISTQVDLARGTVTVQYDLYKAKVSEIKEAIEEQGYDVI